MSSDFAAIVSPSSTFIQEKINAKQIVSSGVLSNLWCDKDETVAIFPEKDPCFHFLHYTLIWDGTIFNLTELWERLQPYNYNISLQDEEAILIAAYDRWKERFLAQLDGVFALAIFDSNEKSLMMARDRMGEKSLFYHAHIGERGRFTHFIFATEIRKLWQYGVPKKLDATMLLNYITLGYTSHPNKKMATFYVDILSLPPGNYLKTFPKEGKIQMRNWYRPTLIENNEIEEKKNLEMFDEVLHQTFSKRLLTSAKKNLFWYEPPNNSLITTAIEQSLNDSSFLFEKPDDYEKSTEQYFQKSDLSFDINESIDEYTLHNFLSLNDEPIGQESYFREYLISKKIARNNIKTIVFNTGYKEIFGNDTKYLKSYLQFLFRTNISAFRKEKAIAEQKYPQLKRSWLQYWGNSSSEKQAQIAQKKLVQYQNSFPYLRKDFLYRYQHVDLLRQPEIDRPEDEMYFDFFTLGLENEIRTKRNIVKHFNMNVSFPFLDNRLVALLFSLPTSFKFRNGNNQWFVREKDVEHNTEKHHIHSHIHAEHKKPIKIEENQLIKSQKKLIEANILEKSILENKKEKHNSVIDWRIINASYFIERIS